jgi:hypothetical protein
MGGMAEVNDMMIVETRDPFAVRDVEWTAGLLAGMRETGRGCTLMLCENGVLAARESALASCLSGLADAGVEILADRFALRERGIPEDRLGPGISGADLDVVIDRLAAGGTVVWR